MVMVPFREKYIADIRERSGLPGSVIHPSPWDKLQDPIWLRIMVLSTMWWMFK